MSVQPIDPRALAMAEPRARNPHPSYDAHRRACVDCHTLGHICRPCRAKRYGMRAMEPLPPLVVWLFVIAALAAIVGVTSHG